mmetsp:Transcript_29801/g.43378  ORF Transcript_29801/g.43378 Transcript_29801/m.43378 type:complete len:84 (+) Transcript_29801:496-747(+)
MADKSMLNTIESKFNLLCSVATIGGDDVTAPQLVSLFGAGRVVVVVVVICSDERNFSSRRIQPQIAHQMIETPTHPTIRHKTI